MDVTPILFYAAVCAALAAFVPRHIPLAVRALIGGTVGIVAASALPTLRALAGF